MSAGTEKSNADPMPIAEELYRAFRSQDLAFFELLDPEIEYHTPFGDVHGSDGVIAFLESIGELYENAGPEPEEFLPAGERVVVLGTWRGTAKATGTRIEARFAHVLRIRDGRVLEFRNYIDSAKILNALEHGT